MMVPLPAALRAALLGLHGHAHEILLDADGAAALAVRTGLGFAALFRAGAVAGAARLDALEGDLTLTAEGRILEADLNLGHDVLALLRAGAAAGRRSAAAEEITEDVAKVAKAAEASESRRRNLRPRSG